MIAADGRVVWVRDQAVLLRDQDGRPLTWQGVMVDITAQKQAEEGLRTSNDDLEFRVLARTAQLEEANELMTLEIGERRRVERELRSAEERFRNLVEDLPAVVYRRQVAASDDDRDHSYASPQIEELLGFTATEWQDDRIRLSRLPPPRPRSGRERVGTQPFHRRTVRDAVPLLRQEREDRAGARPRHDARPQRRGRPVPVPGRPDRSDRSAGGRAKGRRGGGAVPRARRARADGSVQLRG